MMDEQVGWWRCFCGMEGRGTLAAYQAHYWQRHGEPDAPSEPTRPQSPRPTNEQQGTIDGGWETCSE